MKIITWNCNRQFRTKFKDIAEEEADIFVIQECEDPAQSKNEDYIDFAGDNYFWVGKNKSSGLGIFANDDINLVKIENLNEDFDNFIAVNVNDSFNMLGVWAMPPYVEMIHDYFDANKDLFNEKLVMCGDFNSNVIWNNEHKTKDNNGNNKDQSNLNLKLENSNLTSAYHYLTNEKPGKETQDTFYLYRHLNKKFHIDYVYAGAGVVTSLEILDAYKWINLSDHLPIAFEVDFSQTKLTVSHEIKENNNESELIRLSWKDFNEAKGIVYFYGGKDMDLFLNDLKNYPHAFVLGSLMDKQIPAEKAWAIPYKIYQELGNFDIDFLANVPLDKYKSLFNEGKYHRFNDTCAEQFLQAVIKIKNDYDGDASKIWSNNPSSATVVNRFLEFNGIGPKIATMATNILIRQFKIPMSDYKAIDVSVDIQVEKVMARLGLVRENATKQEIINKAREISPDYPGLIDRTLWKVGREYCNPSNPNCKECPLKIECEYYLESNNE